MSGASTFVLSAGYVLGAVCELARYALRFGWALLPKALLASTEEEQRDDPEQKLHEHPLTPRLRSGTWEV